MKKKYIYSSAAAILLSVISYQVGHHQALDQNEENRVSYINSSEQSTGNKKKVLTDTANMSPDEVSAKEGINAEQIVVKITDQGYVTSHGDHYHFYNGKVPFDAIISEELIIKDSSYALKQEDIINEVKDGYIIKVNGTYYLYLKDAKKATNVRTKEEIVRQQQSTGTVRPSQGGQQGTSSATTDKKNVTTTKPYTTDDGYVFSPTDVIDDLGDGFLVPHGDHFHYIPKADLSPAELAAAQAYWNGKKTPAGNSSTPAQPQVSTGKTPAPTASRQPHEPLHTAQPAPSNQPIQPMQPVQPAPNQVGQPAKPDNTDSLDSLLQRLYAQPLSHRHVEADGLVFDPATITKWTERGVVVPHGDHFHFIPYSQMSELEARISRLLDQGKRPTTSEQPLQTNPIGKPAKPALTVKPNQPLPPNRPISSIGEKPTIPTQPALENQLAPEQPISSQPTTPAEPVTPPRTEEASEVAPNKPVVEPKPDSAQPSLPNLPEHSVHPSQPHQEEPASYTTDDGYVFNPTDVIDDLGDGFLVPHGDHFHFIPKTDLSPAELAAAQAYWNSKKVDKVISQPNPVNESTPVLPSQPTQPLLPVEEKPATPAKPSLPDSAEGIPAPAPSQPTPDRPAPVQPAVPSLPISPIIDDNSLESLLTTLYALPLSERHVEADGLVFDPKTISKWTERGVVVPHGDHFHFIPYSQMSELEAKISRLLEQGNELTNPSSPLQPELPSQPALPVIPEMPTQPEPQPTPSNPVEPEETDELDQPNNVEETEANQPEDDNTALPERRYFDLSRLTILKSPKGKDGLPYTTSDGYTFSPESIIAYDDEGFRAEHDDHEHYIFYHELEDDELEAAASYINREGIEATPPSTYSATEIDAKLTFISLENQVPKALLKVSGNQVIIPHGNHSHTANLDKYPTRLTASDFDNPDDYRDLLIRLKMGNIRLQEGVIAVFRDDSTVIASYPDGTEKEFPLASITLPLTYDEVDYSDLVTYKHPQEVKLRYIAKQYKVPRSYVRPLFGNLVFVEGHGGVDLSLVDINDPVIYTLKDKIKPADETTSPTPSEETSATDEDTSPEPDEADTTDSRPSQPTEQPQPKPADQRAELLAYLGQYYGDKASTIAYMPGIGYVITPVAGEENLILSESTVLTSKEKGEALPALGNTADGDEPEEQDSTEHNNSTETPSQPTTDEHHKPTPIAEREGKPNSQIIYSPEEIAEAKAAGRYTTSDGYIFDAKDIEREEGDAYIVPHMDHSHWIPKWDLSYTERRAAEQELASRKPAETEPSRPAPQPNDGRPRERAVDIFDKAEPAKRIPIEKMPYNSAYTVAVTNGYLIIPHYNHYHNIAIARFDDLFEAPAGYSLEDLFATIKYYVENPDERPGSKDGWGRDSDIMKGRGNAENRPNYPVGKEPEEETEDETTDTSFPESEPADSDETPDTESPAQPSPTETEPTSTEDDNLDDYDREMLERATAFGMDREVFEDKLYELAMTYGVGVDTFTYDPETKSVRLIDKKGQAHIISLVD